MRNSVSWIFYILATLLVACSGSGNGKQSTKNDTTDSGTLSASDSVQIIADLAFLSSKECEGRRPGTLGHQKAFERVVSRLRSTGVDTLNGSMIQIFTGRSLQGFTEGKNAIGWIRGKKYPDQYIVLSAHYDHMGKRGDSIWFAGADDNASGTAAALAIAGYLKKNTPDYSVIIAILDREETGLEGARAVVPYLKQILGDSAIKFNLNMDMVARSDKNELYVVGASYYPKIAEWVSAVQEKTSVKLLMGHDGADGKQNWTTQSDHFAFHSAGIPFMYLGVEDHPDYHKHTDKFEKVNPANYFSNCKAALELLKQISL